LVDYLRSLGYKIHYIGGEPPETDVLKHVVEHVMREVRFQGGNVVATRPGRLIAFEGNNHTLEELRASGIQVSTFPGHELAKWHGGPHCLTMPLERL
jgi:arginine deiminase